MRWFTLVLIGVCGCAESNVGGDDASMDEMAALLEKPPAAAEPAVAAVAQPPAPVEEQPQVVTAQTPKRGKVFHNQGGYANAVFSARFTIEHKLILAQVKQAQDHYRAIQGDYPKSHEIFMRDVIELNSIQLPELEEGYEYWYDASDHQLKQRSSDATSSPE